MASLAVAFKHVETAHYAVPHSLVTLITVLCLFYLMRALSPDMIKAVRFCLEEAIFMIVQRDIMKPMTGMKAVLG